MPELNKNEIIRQLNEKVDAIVQYIAPFTKEEFETRPDEKWSAGQVLDHLIRSIKPLQLAYRLPKFVLRFAFGIANRPSKTYDQLVEKYKSKLSAGGKASGRFIPSLVSFQNKDEQLQLYRRQKEKLIKKIQKQTEQELDHFILPHPLLGRLTLREMLYFTIYHNQHHLEGLQRREYTTITRSHQFS